MFSGLRKQLKELEKLKIDNPAFIGAPQAHKVSRGPKRPASEDATRKSSRLKATPPVLDKGGDEGQERENIGRMISKVKNDAARVQSRAGSDLKKITVCAIQASKTVLWAGNGRWRGLSSTARSSG